MYLFGHFFSVNFVVSDILQRFRRRMLDKKEVCSGCILKISEANNCEHGLRTTKIMASNDRYWGFGLLNDLVAKNFLKAGHRS